MKGYIPFAMGFLGAEAVATKPIGDTKYLDWERAQKIIKERFKENPHITVDAGLMEDWGCTSGTVFSNGNFISNEFVFDHSTWATPILDIDGEEIECYTYEPPEKNTDHTPDWWESNKGAKR